MDERQASRTGAPSQIGVPGTAAAAAAGVGVEAVDTDFGVVAWAETRETSVMSGRMVVYIMTF